MSTDITETLGLESIHETVTIEWLYPGVAGLLRFLYPAEVEFPELPYRGVTVVHITNGVYEFKGMVMRDGHFVTKDEHEAVKGYLRAMGLRGISRRLKNGRVITKHYQ